MRELITLRQATMQDADLLFNWRNDLTTRESSRDTSRVAKKDHLVWLKQIQNNPDRELFVAERNGAAVGTVRADLADGVWELSWTVAPVARGYGVAKAMVSLLADQIPGPLRAEVKAENVASARVAEHAGMVIERRTGDVIHFYRDALPENE